MTQASISPAMMAMTTGVGPRSPDPAAELEMAAVPCSLGLSSLALSRNSINVDRLA